MIGPSHGPLPDHTQEGQTSMPPVEFERALPASERPKTQTVDRAATGIGLTKYRNIQLLFSNKHTNWTSLWAPLFDYELRVDWKRKRSDFIVCKVKKPYLKRWYCTGVAQFALQRRNEVIFLSYLLSNTYLKCQNIKPKYNLLKYESEILI